MAHDLSDTSICVIDNPSEIRNTTGALREAGFRSISEITSGLKAISEVKKNPPQVILANLHIPKYSGLQIFKSINAERALASIKFIMVIPKMNKKELEDLSKQGVTNILQRPFGPDQVRNLIFELFGIKAEDLKTIAEGIKKEAYELFNNGGYEEAVVKFRESSDMSPDAECVFMEGKCYLELEAFDQAIISFQNVSKIDRKFPELERWLGVAFQKKEDYQASIRHLKKSVEEEKKPDTLIELGKSYLGAEMEPEADGAFEQATTIEPKNIENRKNIGNAYMDKGKYEKAEAAFSSAIGINPSEIPLYNRMAIALRKQNKHKEAINMYIKALKVAPDDEGLYYNFARALYESGDKEKAVKCLNKALFIDPDFPEAAALKKEYLES